MTDNTDTSPYSFTNNSIIIENCKELSDFVFCNCDNLINVEFNNTTNIKIGKGIFSYCTKLKTVKLNNTLSIIPKSTFNNCINLSNINLDINSIEEIQSDAFANCKQLDNVSFGDNLKYIGINSFSCCNNLASIKLNNKLEIIDFWAFSDCNIKEITIPSSVKEIRDYAFMNNSELTTVNILNKGTIIAENAFENCDKVNIIYA